MILLFNYLLYKIKILILSVLHLRVRQVCCNISSHQVTTRAAQGNHKIVSLKLKNISIFKCSEKLLGKKIIKICFVQKSFLTPQPHQRVGFELRSRRSIT